MTITAPWPRASYRLQFHAGFTFSHALAVLPYLADLGISHLYASPVTAARRGSEHGYDVCDPAAIDPRLGGQEGLEGLIAAARSRGMGWIQDVVPNHLAADAQNPYWRDVLRRGRGSPWAEAFDIDWELPGHEGRILLPLLPEGPAGPPPLPAIGPRGVVLRVGGQDLPLDPATVLEAIGPLPQSAALAAALAAEDLQGLAADDRTALAAALAAMGGEARASLLARQHWSLACWRDGRERVGFRRFFAVDGLVGVRIEEEAVFALMHQAVFSLCDRGLVDALRIDHVDGLREPDAYLRRLRARLPGMPLLVEKILGEGEALPAEWPVDGTTGYEVLCRLAPALASPAGLDRLASVHARAAGASDALAEERRARADVAALGLLGDARRLARAMAGAAADSAAPAGWPEDDLARALAAIAAHLPRYRTYGRGEDRPLLAAAAEAAAASGVAAPGVVAWAGSLLLLGLDPAAPPAVRACALRFQQFSGAAMAKGREDTAFYRRRSWLGDAEVGAAPGRRPTPRELVELAAGRGPWALSPAATHDSKRGEDARNRLAALTWHAEAWERLADRCGVAEDPRLADQRYQALQLICATCPQGGGGDPAYRRRLRRALAKGMREAAESSTWCDPDDEAERRLIAWSEACLDQRDGNGLDAVIAAVAPLAGDAAVVETVVRCGLPGIPDIYQGSEDEDLRMVDPDNRAPVDFAALAGRLAEVAASRAPHGHPARKLAYLRACLRLRAADPELWAAGSATWLLAGDGAGGAIAFERARGGRLAVVVARMPGAPPAGVLRPGAWSACARWGDAFSGAPIGMDLGGSFESLFDGRPARILVPL